MPDVTQDDLTIRNIAIATDFSPWSDRAMQHALLIARWFGATLHILHTVRPSEFSFVSDLMVNLDEFAERDFEELMARLHAAHNLDGVTYRVWNLYGELWIFGDLVLEQKIDLLVLGTRGRTSISKLFLGSAEEQIFHYVSCPVLTVAPWTVAAASRLALKNVLFATDLSAQSTAALPYVLAAAKSWHAAVDVLHVCSPDHADSGIRMDAYRRRLDRFTSTAPWLSLRYHLVPGDPAPAVLDFASRNKEELIVLGLDTHRSLYAGPPLSHTYEIVRLARCPVLSVRSAPESTVRP